MRTFNCSGDGYNTFPSRVIFGVGAADRIGEEVGRLRAARPLFVSTPGRRAMAEGLAQHVGTRVVNVWAEAVSQVPLELAEKGRAHAKSVGADCLVAVGGGASIGLGKAISLELGLPIIAIPTTHSGSEMTAFCGITIEGVKRTHISLRMLASAVIYDPALTVGLPLGASAESAMNALAHCVEAVYVPTASPISALAAVEGARVIADAMPRVVREPSSLDARSDALYGSYLAGAALTGGMALQHGLAHVLGGTFGVSHGLSHALILPHVVAYNSRFAPHEIDRIASAMAVDDAGTAIFDLLVALGLPTSLAEVGFSEEAVGDAARLAVEADNGNNPGPVTLDAVRDILCAALEGRRPARRSRG